MMTPRLLTIQGQGRGETHSIKQWSRIVAQDVPNAAGYHTIINRLVMGWDDERAVFTPVKKGKQCKNEA